MSTYPNAPGHRNLETSIAAANALAPKLGRLQRLAHEAIREAGWLGLTADELAAGLEMDRYSIQPRTSELKCKGLNLGAPRGNSNAWRHGGFSGQIGSVARCMKLFEKNLGSQEQE